MNINNSKDEHNYCCTYLVTLVYQNDVSSCLSLDYGGGGGECYNVTGKTSSLML